MLVCRKYLSVAVLATLLMAVPGVLNAPAKSSATNFPVLVTPAGDKEELIDLMNKIAAVTNKISEAGYAVAHVEIDRLKVSGSYSVKRQLYGGNSYRVIGVGGIGFSNVDAELLDPAGKSIAKDVEADTVPIVDANPSEAGVYTAKINAVALSKNATNTNEYYFGVIFAFKKTS